MVRDSTFFQITLDDGQFINDKLSSLTRSQIISLANQHRRARQCTLADELMHYQHNKFSTNSPHKG